MAGLDLERHAKAMFTAGSNLGAKTDSEILYQDFKKFKTGSFDYGVGQISSMDGDELTAIIPRMRAFMEQELMASGLDMMFFMLTDILKESTILLCVGENALEMLREYGGYEIAAEQCLYMEGVVSRKKQLIPALIHALV